MSCDKLGLDLSNSLTCNELYYPVIALPDGMINGVITTEPERSNSEAWSSLLRPFADEYEGGIRRIQDSGVSARSCEIHAPFLKVSAGPWQSLGGRFDYSDWGARERFVELDQAIAAIPYHKQLIESESDIEMF
jgi:hypothetical protein